MPELTSDPLPEPALFPLVAYGPGLPDQTAETWGMHNDQWACLAEVRRGGTFERYVNGELVHLYLP
jgi:hypothetical protein